MKRFCDKLKKARQDSGASQAELADEVGVSTRTLENWEQGRNEPNGMTQSIVLETAIKGKRRQTLMKGVA